MSDEKPLPAKHPCGSCPYRRDVPSAVWDASEYRKLPQYDEDSPEQPLGAFFCHQQDGRLCAGWAGTHDMGAMIGPRLLLSFGQMTGEQYDRLLAYATTTPLWGSGKEAAAHGMKGYLWPGEKARKVVEKLERKRSATSD